MDKQTPDSSPSEDYADARLAALVRAAAGGGPSGDARERVRAAVHGAWRESVDVSATAALRRHRPWRAALAASLFVTALIVGWQWQATATGSVARVAELAGAGAELDRPWWRGGSRALETGDPLRPGDSVSLDGNAAARVVLASGIDLRVGAGSSLVWRSTEEIDLVAGQVYVDSAPKAGSASGVLRVRTPLGEVTHVGTRYLTRVTPELLEVAVRAGRISIDSKYTAGPGELLSRSSTGGSLQRTPIATYGERWEWLNEVPAPFELEGATLGAFLDWYARETGLNVELDQLLRARVSGARLRGSIATLSPAEALDVVLAATDLSAARGDGSISIISR